MAGFEVTPEADRLARLNAFIWSNLCTRHIPNKLKPRGHQYWPDKRATRTELTVKDVERFGNRTSDMTRYQAEFDGPTCTPRDAYDKSRSRDFSACSFGVFPFDANQSHTRRTLTEWFTTGA